MATRAFRSAAGSPRTTTTPAASPLLSKNAGLWGSTGLANLQWLLRRKRASKVRHGQQLAAGSEYDDDKDDERASIMFAGATPDYYAGGGTPYYNAGATPCYSTASAGATPYSAACRNRKRGGGEAALTRLRTAVLAVLARARRAGGASRPLLGSCSCVTGTVFGRRRGRVHVALQADPRAPPALVLELAAYSTGALVREMASSGLVRLALECERTPPPSSQQPGGDHNKRRRPALVEEPTWRAYCNGRKCGYAVRRDCGAEEWRVLRAVGPVSVGAGVIPPDDADAAAADGDMMYMRATFERVVGSRDSEAFYMLNPDDSAGGPELSIYLLRV